MECSFLDVVVTPYEVIITSGNCSGGCSSCGGSCACGSVGSPGSCGPK